MPPLPVAFSSVQLIGIGLAAWFSPSLWLLGVLVVQVWIRDGGRP